MHSTLTGELVCLLEYGGMSAITVLVAEGQRVFAEALADALGEHEGLDVVEAYPHSLAELLDAIAVHQPDVALIDYHLDVTPPEEVVAVVRQRRPDTRVLVLSSRHHEDAVERLLAAGAAGYLPTSCDLDTIGEAIARAHAGEQPVFGDRLDRLVDSLEQRRVTAQEAARRLADLTARELEVLEWLAAGYTAAGIADELGASPSTVQTHIRNLKAKTGARTHLEAVRMAHGKAAVCLPDRLPA